MDCRQEVEQLLEAANWAPTHGRTEPWRFVVLGQEAQTALIDLTLQVCALPGSALIICPCPQQQLQQDHSRLGSGCLDHMQARTS